MSTSTLAFRSEVAMVPRFFNASVINYVDDYIGFGVPSDARASYDLLYDLLQKLGLTVSQKKLVPPATLVTCLGVEINTITGTIAIPTNCVKFVTPSSSGNTEKDAPSVSCNLY